MRGGATELNKTQKWATSKKGLRTTVLEHQGLCMNVCDKCKSGTNCVKIIWISCNSVGQSHLQSSPANRRFDLSTLYRSKT
jgi:hypothetical protein